MIRCSALAATPGMLPRCFHCPQPHTGEAAVLHLCFVSLAGLLVCAGHTPLLCILPHLLSLTGATGCRACKGGAGAEPVPARQPHAVLCHAAPGRQPCCSCEGASAQRGVCSGAQRQVSPTESGLSQPAAQDQLLIDILWTCASASAAKASERPSCCKNQPAPHPLFMCNVMPRAG